MTRGVEVLAPVGGKEQLKAALNAGADAVYFGTPDFNARRNAENFSAADFSAAVAACHVRGVKAYVTLNTLVTDAELPALTETLALIADSGADAVIVQDLGVAALVKKCCPSLPLHASTQMAAHNVSGAKLLGKLGFRRIVLARELSLREIGAVAAAVDCEIEVFVHGAQCMSASGLCYLSSALGGRSGNRGLCAQPCRLNFRAGAREYALSLRDMSLLPHLEALKNAGVDSFKIEGRMKRPEYVAAAVDAVKKTLNGAPADTEALRRVFSRSGFTDGYLTGKRTLSMFGVRGKEDVTAAAGVLPSLQELYKDEYKRAALTMALTVQPGVPAKLTVSDGAHTVTAEGAAPEAARTRALDAEACEKSLCKLGGTPYFCSDVNCTLAPDLMLPAAALNALRRDAIKKLDALRAGKPHAFTPPDKTWLSPENTDPAAAAGTKKRLWLRFERAEQIPDNVRAGRIILPAAALSRRPDLIRTYEGRLTAEIPVLVYPAKEGETLEQLKALQKQGLKTALCENIGAIALARQAGLVPIGGAHLNITNRLALREYLSLGLAAATLSFELHFSNIAGLRREGRTGFIAYGHLPLMRFRACPMQGETGCGACSGRRTLTDRRGEAFPVLCGGRQFSTLLNPVPLYTGNMKLPAADFCTLYFTVEDKKACADVIAAFLERKNPAFRKTAGQYDKKLL